MISKFKWLKLALLFFTLLFVTGLSCSLQQPVEEQNVGYISLSINDSEDSDVSEIVRTIYPQIDTSKITYIRLYGTKSGGLKMPLGSWDDYTSMRATSRISLVPGEWELKIELIYNYQNFEDTKNVTITANTSTPVKFNISNIYNSTGSLRLKIKYSQYSSFVNKITATFSKYPSMEEVDKRDLYSVTEDEMKYVQYTYNVEAGLYYVVVTFYSLEGELNRYSNIVKIQNGLTSDKEYYMDLNSKPLGYVYSNYGSYAANLSSSESQVFNGRMVSIPRLLVSDHEVTQKEWKDVFGKEQKDINPDNKGWGDDYPVYYVNWYGAIAYCNKRSAMEGKVLAYTISGISYDDWKNFAYSSIPTANNAIWNSAVFNETADGWRLPTEIEWEYLARSCNLYGVQTIYSGSDDKDSVAWYSGNSLSKTHVVRTSKNSGTNSSNSYGIFDLSGNVFEWCWDWKGTIDSTTSQTGPSSGEYRVVRGGGWSSTASECTVSYRNINMRPYESNNATGFRIVHKSN